MSEFLQKYVHVSIFAYTFFLVLTQFKDSYAVGQFCILWKALMDNKRFDHQMTDAQVIHSKSVLPTIPKKSIFRYQVSSQCSCGLMVPIIFTTK